MDDPQVIQKQMEETRVSLQEKVELLEQQVVGTVQNAADAVTDTVDTVKQAVEETVHTVKDTVDQTLSNVLEGIDLRSHVEEHPWPMLLGAVAVGFVGGRLLDATTPSPTTLPATGPLAGNGNGQSHGVLAGVTETFGPELRKLKELALGATGAIVRDLVTANVPPPVRGQLAEVIDDFTAKLGGKPIHGRVLDTGSQTSG